MADYISREAVINITAETGAWETQNRVRELPSADVQPVNQWISVENQLPEIGESVLVAVVVNAKLNIPFRTDFTPEFRIGWLEDDGKWGLQFDSADNHEILYWQPLPELPKDGDAE